MRSKYCDPIENFPDKIDQLLDALNRVRLFKNKIKSYFVLYIALHESTKR